MSTNDGWIRCDVCDGTIVIAKEVTTPEVWAMAAARHIDECPARNAARKGPDALRGRAHNLRAAAARPFDPTDRELAAFRENVLAAATALEHLARIQDAWAIEGPHPDIHYAEQERLRKRWPALARALEGSLR